MRVEWISIAALLSACTLAPTIAPPIQNSCPQLPKLPEEINLNVSGDTVKADKGGDLILRGYVACRASNK